MRRRSFLNATAAGLASTLALGRPGAAQFIPKASERKWAVLFGTWYGTARDAAVWISEGMGGIAAVFDVRQDPDLSPFDHLVVGTAIQGGKGPKALEAYLGRNMDRIKGKVRGLYAVCGNLERPAGPQNVKDLIDDYLARLTGAGPVAKRVFGGRVTKALWSEEDFKTVRDLYAQLQMPPLKDYDNLRRPDCLAFGGEVLAKAA
ncbi:MAG TPA: flavodoxin domain-containing protein [Candidatus Aminicenantes bacterium]|nr:flavodoxin domain-containing protein [Candidatus Aminicenantes bacterium]